MTALQQHRHHPRTFHDNRFVYPVLSRRSHGLSVGINLNPDKICNFDCIYCQVDRTSQAETRFVELDAVLDDSMPCWPRWPRFAVGGSGLLGGPRRPETAQRHRFFR
ncbi:MAG: hypothetical protein CM1200mP2_43480 [Planctomycetaceae bacterium]|nr:MAG: hypothetical protein CM1200mP2_43480 [Planctomycetaceae bacterium]